MEADDELPLLAAEADVVVDQRHVDDDLPRPRVDGEGRQRGQVGRDQEPKRLRRRLGPEDAAATRVLGAIFELKLRCDTPCLSIQLGLSVHVSAIV